MFECLGHSDGRTGREFIGYIAEAITEKCAGILAGSHAMNILTDGSQARKTGSDKEMVLVRIERQGNVSILVDMVKKLISFIPRMLFVFFPF